MEEENLIYKRINEKIEENNGFDELVIFDIENVYGCNSIKTKNKKCNPPFDRPRRLLNRVVGESGYQINI